MNFIDCISETISQIKYLEESLSIKTIKKIGKHTRM